MEDVVGYTDAFVICSGQNPRHVQADRRGGRARSSSATRACCRRAARAGARAIGSCSTTSTASCTCSRPRRARSTASSSCGARCPSARSSDRDVRRLPGRLGLRGAVAQLGERSAGSAEVMGSIPIGSTPRARPCRRRCQHARSPRYPGGARRSGGRLQAMLPQPLDVRLGLFCFREGEMRESQNRHPGLNLHVGCRSRQLGRGRRRTRSRSSSPIRRSRTRSSTSAGSPRSRADALHRSLRQPSAGASILPPGALDVHLRRDRRDLARARGDAGRARRPAPHRGSAGRAPALAPAEPATCESDVLADDAWELFGETPPRRRARAGGLRLDPRRTSPTASPSVQTTTTIEIYERRGGMCRDFAHLGVDVLPRARHPRALRVRLHAGHRHPRARSRRWTSTPGSRSGSAIAGGRSTRASTRRASAASPIGHGRDAVDVAMVTTYGGR